MVQAIIFDLGNVIVPFQFSRGYQQLEALCGIPAQEIPRRIGSTGLVRQLETGQIEPEAFVTAISAHLNLDITYPEFRTIWSSIFLPETLIPESLLHGLKQNYKLLLLSNTNAIHFQSIQENYPLLHYFDHAVLSYQVNAMKPDLRIYQEAARLAQCPPEQCLFIDDLPENIEGAKQAGMGGILFLSYADLVQQLHAWGVQWEEAACF